MAVSSSTTAAAIHISRHNYPISTTKSNSIFFLNYISFAAKRRQYNGIVTKSSSSDGFTETTVSNSTEVKEDEFEEETSIEAPEGTSLITALNVERALRGAPITDKDYYGILGIKRECSTEEIRVAYKNKVEELLNQGLDEPQVRDKMELLKESYTILSSADEKRMYDWSLVRSERPDRYAWPYEIEKFEVSTNTPPPVQEPEDVQTTRLVGYFILGWLLLSFVFSIALNR
ncbi:NAD(P)H-quinone oxidoreductase subunit U, chloroplastic [Mercurialis annua]|uniref:NAD(P)H-quinone oxidoreductase subunit U, chloroplastic n=1 Tax=Mercurialis annua TaxID=3986 RepID=UPI002160B8A9|nr:NAD(P)H-quinone oxidoreductase subunit U, chloroplastic [Mercurialis annua]